MKNTDIYLLSQTPAKLAPNLAEIQLTSVESPIVFVITGLNLFEGDLCFGMDIRAGRITSSLVQSKDTIKVKEDCLHHHSSLKTSFSNPRTLPFPATTFLSLVSVFGSKLACRHDIIGFVF